jgi:hypothetical protein
LHPYILDIGAIALMAIARNLAVAATIAIVHSD